jgi:hypothetical protein
MRPSTPGPDDDLERERLRRHRLDPSAPITSAAEAEAFVHDRRIVVNTGTSAIAVMAWAIAGRRFPGSWMAQPEVHRIYDLLESLQPPRCWTVRLIEGKYTTVTADLAPVVARYAADEARRGAAEASLGAAPARLLAAVRRDGEVRMDEWPGTAAERAAARRDLDRRLLVVTEEVHADRGGAHVAVVRPWTAGPFADRLAGTMAFDDTVDALVVAGLHSAVVAPAAGVRRWFSEAGAALERLVGAGVVVALGGGRVALRRALESR